MIKKFLIWYVNKIEDGSHRSPTHERGDHHPSIGDSLKATILILLGMVAVGVAICTFTYMSFVILKWWGLFFFLFLVIGAMIFCGLRDC